MPLWPVMAGEMNFLKLIEAGGMMRKTRLLVTSGCCIFAMAMVASAQSRKAGLWEITSTTSFQQGSSNVGMFSGVQAGNAGSVDSPTDNPQPLGVCLTQALIDKYGISLPPSLRDCQLSNVVNKVNSLTADLTCSGRSNGKGTLESSWSDENHATGKIHFSTKAKQGPKTLSMTWTQKSSAVFKSEDCGSVKPRAIPAASAIPAK